MKSNPVRDLDGLGEPELQHWWAEAVAEPGSVFGDVTITEVLRHLPGRRVTFLGERGGEDVIVKVFSSPRARGNHRRLLALANCESLPGRVPRSLGVSASGHVGLLDFTPGRILEQLPDDEFVARAREVGETLAGLHASPADLDRSWTHHDEVAQLLRRMPASGLALAGVESARPVSEATLAPSHRDFHPRQVVVDDVVKLIDLDDAALAPAGLDVGNMVAHLRREAVAGRRTTDVAEAAIDRFLAGYGAAPADLDVWERLSLIRLVGLAESRHRDPALRDGLLAVLAAHSAPTQLVVTGDVATGHDDRPVRIVTPIDGAAYVSKRYLSTDGAGIHEAMVALWASPFGERRVPAPGLPEPLSFDVRRGELRMSLAPGAPLGERGELGAAVARGAEAATLLADLHASDVSVTRIRDARSLVRSALRKTRDRATSLIGEELARTVEHVGAALLSAHDGLDLVLTHGDFSPRNVLATKDRVTLIDFDRLQLSSPLRDLAYWTTWLWATATSQGMRSADAWSLGEEFVATYSARSGVALEARRSAFASHRALALIRIVHGWSSLRTDHANARRMLHEARTIVVDPDRSARSA